jgi:hypothetical protein
LTAPETALSAVAPYISAENGSKFAFNFWCPLKSGKEPNRKMATQIIANIYKSILPVNHEGCGLLVLPDALLQEGSDNKSVIYFT